MAVIDIKPKNVEVALELLARILPKPAPEPTPEPAPKEKQDGKPA